MAKKRPAGREDDGEVLPSELRAFAPVELEQRIAFRVANLSEQNPHEGGALVVVADPDGLELHFWGARAPRWKCTWTEVRWLIERVEREKREEARLRKEAAAQRAATRQRLKRARQLLRHHPLSGRRSHLRIVEPPPPKDP